MATAWQPVPEIPEWASLLEVSEAPALAEELRSRLPAASAARPVGVTDLLSLRPAFWRALAPVVVDPARAAALEAGRLVHRALGPLFEPEAALEVRVRRGGISGRIDVLADVPIEVKATTTAPGASDLARLRPEYVEQLGFYCALSRTDQGRLLLCGTDGPRVRIARVADVRFRRAADLEEEMRERAEALRSAWESGSPAGLPRCRWRGRGCEFESGGICDCTGEESPPSARVLDAVAALEPRPDLDERWSARLARLGVPPEVPFVDRFRDLVYPRRTFFERTAPVPVGPTPEAPWSRVPDLYQRLAEAIESGPVGEVARVPPRSEEPREEVTGWRGVPYLLRTSRGWSPPTAGELVERSGQYAVDLGFRCAATGTASALVVWGGERAGSERDRIRVFDLRFRSVTAFARLWRSRASALRAAISTGAPFGLPPCPAWMYAECPYRPGCACSSETGLSHR